MRIPYDARPGAGFLFLLAAGVLSLLFFAFGLFTPRLDRVWRSSIELRLGLKKPLSEEDFRVFQRALCDHQDLADDFLEGRPLALISANRYGLVESGRAYLIRQKDSALGIAVTIPRGGKKQRRIAIRARTLRDDAEGIATHAAPFSWVPPEQNDCPTLIEVRGSKGIFSVGATP